ncbi:MAG: amidohydrolase family protein [Candidatus Omnitrophica bacterium]|nr:amidohydrolase family protein [Candidatus Omnitrophota bacterium]
MITDCHVHIGKSNWLQVYSDARDLIEAADHSGIDRMMVTDLTALVYDIEEGNRLIREAIADYRDRMIPYYTLVTGRHGKKILEDFERYVTDYGFRGLKIYSVPPLQLIDDPYMLPFIEKAAELRIPILAHSTGAECESLSRQVPECILLNAHMGCCPQAHGDWHASVAAAKKFPNIYLDTTSSSFDNGMIEFAVEEVGAERVLYGSDLPLLDPTLQIAKVTESDITQEQKNLILHGNIDRILKLRGTE